jgi:hypothetical protein
MNKPLIFSIFCIDYRFDAMIASFYENTGKEYSYYANTNAGGSLSLGYKQYCSELCVECKDCNENKNPSNQCCNPSNQCCNPSNQCCNPSNQCCNPSNPCCNPSNPCCNPSNPSMELLKKSIVENLNIALTLSDIDDIYLLNHQDCGAIKEFLACSGYPKTLGENNKKEIKIVSNLLIFSKRYMKKKFPTKKYILGFVDINGSVGSYDCNKKIWTIIYVGEFNDPKGTWYNMPVGSTYKL